MGGIDIYLDEEDRQMAMKSKNSELDLLRSKQLWDIEIEMSSVCVDMWIWTFPREEVNLFFFYFS